jgi:hypothetical protein
MNKTYLLTLDATTQKKKPSKQEFKIISNNINKVVALTSQEIVGYASPPYCYTFCPAILNGSRNNNNWGGQQIFMLDFDTGISPKVIIDRLTEYDIIPNIIYYTFSHTEEHPRFRIVLLVEEPIFDYSVAETIRKGLVKGFPDCDKKCVDAARIFLGGQMGEELNVTPNSISQLMNFSSIYIVATDKQQTRNLQKNGYSNYNSNRTTHISAKNNNSSLHCPPRNEFIIKQKYNAFNFELLKEKLKIVKDFTSGKELKYLQLFGLITNVIHTKGGEKYLKDIMNTFNKEGLTAYKPTDFAIIPVVKFYDYLPQRIEGFSPYTEDHRFTDIFDAVKKPRGEVQIIKPLSKIKLSEAEQILDMEFNKAIASHSDNIYIFQTQTAIGKSSRLVGLTQTTLAFPTHKLKNEIFDKMAVDCLVVPELPVFNNHHVNDRIKALYQIGLNSDVHILLKNIAICNSAEYTIEDINLAKEFLDVIDKSTSTTETVLTTHLRAIFDPYSHDTIIFDEDPINSLLSIKKFELSDLWLLANQLDEYSYENEPDEEKPITKILEYINKTKSGIINKVNFFGINQQLIISFISENHPNTNLIQFFDATAFYKDKNDPNIIHYLIKREIPQKKKVIILSATPQIEIYTSLYGDRVKVIDIPLAEGKGEVKQYTKNGYSRTYIKKNEFPALIEKIGDKNVITFKSFKHKFPTAHPDIHYGNCEGYDILKGQDLAVVGTPHQNVLKYLFMAFAVGIDLKRINLTVKDLKIDWKGFRFRFFTYEDERLRNIQLGIIEAELVQAIGRARSLRTNAEVLVFANLPLQVSTSINP